MFGLWLISDLQKRSKNERPHHRTTGVDSANSSQGRFNGSPFRARVKACGQNMLAMAIANSGTVKATPTEKRRVMSPNSGFSSRAPTVRGSSAMPQIGHAPGSARTISGCIGQVYSGVKARGMSGSSAMPQDGQAPGLVSRTSGHMGQT